MRFLFYLIHPAKYHLFRYTINRLKEGHTVDIVINNKDVLENLIKQEGWEYTKIFPKGRNISKKPSILKSGLKFILTILRLEKYLWGKARYDVFVTDDALVINGWWRRIPTYIFNDNDIETIKINKILFYFAYKIISPLSVNLGSFNKKKISFIGNKALAHLHPLYFFPSKKNLGKYGLQENNYCIIRISKINATHDIGNNGLTDKDLDKCISLCNKNFKIVISTERELNNKYKEYLFNGNPNEFADLMYYAKIIVTDSATMASETAILGTPNVLINKVGKRCSVNKDLFKNGLQYYFDSFNESISTIEEILRDSKLKDTLREKAKFYIDKCDDLNNFLINTLTSLN